MASSTPPIANTTGTPEPRTGAGRQRDRRYRIANFASERSSRRHLLPQPRHIETTQARMSSSQPPPPRKTNLLATHSLDRVKLVVTRLGRQSRPVPAPAPPAACGSGQAESTSRACPSPLSHPRPAGWNRRAAPLPPSNDLQKTEAVLYLSQSRNLSRRGRANGAVPRERKKLGFGAFNPQPERRVERELRRGRNFFIPIRSNPLKSLDSEK